jgi:hypothetical protein
VAADRGGRSGQCNLFLYGDSGMFILNKQDLNSEGWKTMTQKLTSFSDLFIFVAKRAYIVAIVNDAIQTMR